MNPENYRNPTQKIIPKPVRRLMAKVVEVAQVTFDSQNHAESIAARDERKKLQEQRRVTHILGMSLAHSIKADEPIEEQLLMFKNALNELPPRMGINSVGLDDEQLGTLGTYFEVPPLDEQ